MAQPKPLRDRLTQHMLERLRTRKMTNEEAADKLGVSVTYLSRIVATMQTKERGQTMLEREAVSKLAAERRHHRERMAKEVKNGNLDVATAAKRAKCSERTIKRFVAAYTPPRRNRTKA